MHLTFLRTWRGYVEGRTYDVPEGAAQIYLASGRATLAKKPPEETRQVAHTPPVMPRPKCEPIPIATEKVSRKKAKRSKR